MPKTPTLFYRDSYTLGQLARHWDKPTAFVDRMISEGKLVVNAGLVTNEALGNFYKAHGTDLD